MATNSLLTIDMVTNEALRVLHQKLRFVKTINRQYDDSFAVTGAKIGQTLRIRKPPQYTVTTGPTFSGQNSTETSVTLPLSTQKHVDLDFTSVDLTMSVDNFSDRFLVPAMAVLAANIEADALSMSNSVYNVVDNIGAAASFNKFLQGRKQMVDNLAPMDGKWACQLNTQDNVDMVDTLKGLFQSSSNIKAQYEDGVLGQTAGFEFYENTLLSNATTGTATNTGYLMNATLQSGSSITVDTGVGTWAVGDAFTIANVFRVHPETKSNTGILQQFVVTLATAASATALQIQPAITLTTAFQNVNSLPADNAALTKIGTTSTIYKPSLLYHQDAFTFATADLYLPKGVEMASRQVYDGISMRIVKQYDAQLDRQVTRADVLYGYVPLYPQLASRVLSN